MSNYTDTVTIQLGQEELLFLLRSINAQSLPGMGSSPLSNISKEIADLLMDAAGRSLLAHNILAFDSHNVLQVDRGVHAAVSVCAYPEQMVAILFRQHDETVQQYYFYRVAELAVRHTFPLPGIHVLDITTYSDMGASKIEAILRSMPDSIATAAVYSIDQVELVKIQELAEEQDNEAVSRLIKIGFSLETATAFVKALAVPDFRLVLQFFYHITPEVEQKVFTIVANNLGCWMIQANNLESNTVTLRLLPSEHVLQVISEAYKPFREPLS